MKIRLTFLILINLFVLNNSYSDEKFNLGKDVFLNAGNC